MGNEEFEKISTSGTIFGSLIAQRGPQGVEGPEGPQGPQGNDYILTELDKQEIANKASDILQPTLESIQERIVANENNINQNKSDIENIDKLIPNQATESNQLADKEFVNSSISTNTANFIGTFNSFEELESYTGALTNNDYAFVKETDTQGNIQYSRYKYNGTWIFEYILNNSSFTSEQWASIQSGITAELVEQIITNKNDLINLDNKKTEKIELIYTNNTITRDGQPQNFKQLYDLLKETPDFVYLLSGGWVYLPTYIQYGTGMDYIRFGSTIIGDGKSKTSNIYIQSNDGISISGISSTVINSENTINKTNEITDSNKGSTELYPSIKGVVDFIESKGYVKSTDTEITNKELSANKSQIIDESTTKYPSNKAVKDYIDSLDGNEVVY